MSVRIGAPEPLPAVIAAMPQRAITVDALAHCEQHLTPFLGWAASLALNGSLSRREHELLALRISHLCASPFEWEEHSGFAKRDGLTDDEIADIAVGPDAARWTPLESLLLRVADELHATTRLSQPTYAALAEHYDEARIVEAVYVVGQYTMMSMVANVVEDA